MLYDLEELLLELSGEDYAVVDVADVESSTVVPLTVPPAPSSTDQTNFEVSAADNFSVEYDRSFVVLQLIMCCLGVIGNLLMMFIVLALAEYKKAATHWYVFQLAITNIFFLLTIPFKVSEEINGGWIFPLWMCKAKETLLYLNYYSSIAFLVAMSIERYIVTRHGFSRSPQNRRTSFSAYATTTTIWIICLLMCIPEMLYTGLQATGDNCRCTLEFKENPTSDACLNRNVQDEAGGIYNTNAKETDNENTEYIAANMVIDDSDYYAWSTEKDPFTLTPAEDILAPGCHYLNATKAFAAVSYFNLFGMLILPVIAMAIYYILIALHVRRSRSRRRRLSSSTADDKSQQLDCTTSSTSEPDGQDSNLITTMCAAMVFLFVVCWLPYHVQHLAKITGIAGVTSDYCEGLSAVTTTLLFVNSTINPFLYTLIGTRFGQRLRSTVSAVRRSSGRRISFKRGRACDQSVERPSADTASRESGNGACSQKTNGLCLDDENHLIACNQNSNRLVATTSSHVPNQRTDEGIAGVNGDIPRWGGIPVDGHTCRVSYI